MDHNRASGWSSQELELLNEAAKCPVCELIPVLSLESVLEKQRVFLRCPKGHPYVICGDNLIQAIGNWNRYITLRIQADTQHMISMISKNVQCAYCRSCQRYTKSITSFDTNKGDATHIGYSVVKQECAECHLIKSQKEAA